ncbi:hypothetical protein C0Q70_17234 [Pomacea canaliculata]|uniref:NAD-dependent epimerase/dehydratase domain-containing protein n=1 Tax=Pomacea canaliculata TaxID=400727 RepID=A0A2T7NS30_POMCA|nr:hypothetical protein C0Q70_17234 [Pomacea canaliculata]
MIVLTVLPSSVRVDFRSLRYPGVISADTMPGGGTTDYALTIFHDALSTKHHVCYLRPDTRLPMMYVDDTLRATVDFLAVSSQQLSMRTYNVSAFSFTPHELAAHIRNYLSYSISHSRDCAADQWPEVFDDSRAQQDWGWQPRYDVDLMCDTMMQALLPKYSGSQVVEAMEK